MSNKPSKDEIIAWLQHRDFNTGIELYGRIKRSAQPKNLKALIAKLCYIYDIEKPNALVPTHKTDGADLPLTPAVADLPLAPIPKSVQQSPTHSTTAPHFIEKIVKEHARLVMLRSQLDEQRKELGISNTEPVVKKRRTISQSIHEVSEKIERLYNAKEDYYNKAVMPDMAALGLEKTVEKTPSTAETQKKLTSLRNAQKKDQNLLDFQTNNAQNTPNPMPDGPKRRAIMKRMENRLKEIEKLSK